MNRPKKILMLCLGNICRSPLAEALLRSKIPEHKAVVDSAGLDDWHKGEAPCKTSQEIAKKNNLDISNLRSRPFNLEDFDKFDKIYIMDRQNWEMIKKIARNAQDIQKVDFILNEVYPGENLDVPDSYNKGKNAAELVFKMLDEATSIIAKKYSDA